MEKFDYYNPTRIINGRETHKEIGKLLSADEVNSVLLVYGKSHIEKSGLLDEVLALLEKENISVVLHGGVMSNPVLSHAEAGVKKAMDAKVDAILAIGGGSVIDESKAIAAASKTEGKVWELFTGLKAAGALPLYTILTISAAGSEMNRGGVLTNEATQEKFNFGSLYSYPKISIINPELAESVPAEYLVYSAVDAITHCLEVYFTAASIPNIQMRYMENIVTTVIENTEKLLSDTTNYEARAEFSLAATWALNYTNVLGVRQYDYPNHMIEHSLSAIYNVPHGAGLAVVLPAWMKWSKPKHKVIFEQFAQHIFQLSTADDAINGLEAWYKKIGAPVTLAELNIDKDKIGKIADNAYLTSKRWGMTETYSPEVIAEILALA